VINTPDGLKVLIILLDVRFDYQKSSHDLERLGPYQQEWLDNVLEVHKDANVTLIGSGI
jgi:hypothetical protein